MQAVRFEGSLLSSLSELKAIEEQRIAEERAARDHEAAARVAAIEAAEQQRIAAEAARVEAERTAQLALERARYEAEREARIRVETAEAAERARYQAQLQAQRQAEELAIAREKVARQRPTWMLAVTALAVVAAGVMVWFTLQWHQASARANEARAISEEESRVAREDAKKSKQALLALEASVAQLDGEIATALVAAEKARTKAEAEAAAKRVADLERRKAAARAAIAKERHDQWLRDRGGPIKVDDRCKGNPLC
ncbi:MAG TPA: hypothetical protein VIU61_19730 [Kofleriaceae bacterium]